MQYTIRKLYSTERKTPIRSVRIERIVRPSAPLTVVRSMDFLLSVPNEMQYTIRKLYSTERKTPLRSVRIERIVRPSAPLTVVRSMDFF